MLMASFRSSYDFKMSYMKDFAAILLNPLDCQAEPLLDRRSNRLGTAAAALPSAAGGTPLSTSTLASRTFSTPRHTTHYLENGQADGPLMISPSQARLWAT